MISLPSIRRRKAGLPRGRGHRTSASGCVIGVTGPHEPGRAGAPDEDGDAVKPRGAAAAGPNAAVARPAAMAKSRIDIVRRRAPLTGSAPPRPTSRPIPAETTRKAMTATSTDR